MGPIALALLTSSWLGLQLTPPVMPGALDLERSWAIADLSDASIASAAAQPGLADPRAEASAEGQTRTAMDWTRTMSIGSLLALTFTGMLGAVQFGDQYGFHGSYADTRCAQGSPVLSGCGTEPAYAYDTFAAASAVFGTAALVASTAIDFDRAAHVGSGWRTYETTRWVQFGLVLAQAVYGLLLANAVSFGWADRARDFDALQAASIGQLTLGLAALGLQFYDTLLVF